MLVHVTMSAETKIEPIDKDMEQMHALDIRVKSIRRITGKAVIPFEGPTTHGFCEMVDLVQFGQSYVWNLTPGVYSFDAVQQVEMGKTEAGWLVPRSSLTRNGVDVRSALYDAGYIGGVNGIIVVHNPQGIVIEEKARIAQFVVVKAETAKLYDGQYQGVK